MRTVRTKHRAGLAIGVVVIILASCRKEPPLGGQAPTSPMLILPTVPYSYVVPPMPAHFDNILLQFWESTPADNPVTDDGATLGRVLFYDHELSANRTKSCGSCHHQVRGFADPHPTSMGHTGSPTRRNSMHFANQFYSGQHFWDFRAETLEEQVLMPIQDPVEMGMTMADVIQRLEMSPHYAHLFTNAFGDEAVTAERISRALAQFVRSIASYRTRYDEGEANGFADFTPMELAGRDLFLSGTIRCANCHMTANFHNREARNNGLDAVYADNGLGEVTNDPADNGKFKVSSLRNVELTAPYMHDGRFSTLEQVVEHYNSGVQPHPNLDDRLTVEMQVGGTPRQLHLTAYEKQALIAFLKTLTDVPMVTDPRFADPFVH